MRRLSVALDQLRDHYDVVVVGSGYGGAIAAARLAEAGRSVCVLERGRELLPGEFPNDLLSGLGQVQWRNRSGRHGRRTGLFDLRTSHDVSVLVGCGLGGTSLINAGVCMRPPGWVFEDERWPAPLRDGGTALGPYFDLAEQMLGVSPYPGASDIPIVPTVPRIASDGDGTSRDGTSPAGTANGWPLLPKLEAMREVASAVGGELHRPRLAVNFHPDPASGFDGDSARPACKLCGDCVTGCNYGAKNTVTVNYLPLAVDCGAQLFTEAEVQTVLPSPLGGWTVSFASLADRRSLYDAPSLFVRADTVVLAAGTLGSTDILFRSSAAGLAVSPRLGHAFSGNGDALAVAYEAEQPVRGIGLGRTLPTPETAVGPCIAGTVLVPGSTGAAVSAPGNGVNGWGRDGRGDVLIQEGAVPNALRPLLPLALAVASESDDGGSPMAFLGRLAQRAQTSLSRLLGLIPVGPGGVPPAERTLTFLLMGDDRGDGRLVPDGDGVQVQWAGAGDHPIFGRGGELLARASSALRAELIRNPLSTPTFHDSLLTVHPLGGCPMGEDGRTGVVDDRGRVFVGDGAEVHDGLLVMDGAIVPRPLTVNPLLTISALAERASDLLVHGGTSGGPPPGPPADRAGKRRPVRSAPAAPSRPGLRFTERMRGFLGRVAELGPEPDAEDLVATTRAGAARGRADGTSVDFVLTVGVDDLPALLEDPSQPGTLAGTVVAPLLSPQRLRVVDGAFTLVREDRTHVDTWHMRYVMELLSEEGRRFRFEGTKFLHDRAGLDAWGDTTTLHVTVTETTPADSPSKLRVSGGLFPPEQRNLLFAAGVMRLGPGDFARQLATMRVTGVEGRLARLTWLARFDARFLRSLLKVYGGPLDDVAEFPDSLRKRMPLTGSGNRRLRLPAPEPRWRDKDGLWHVGEELGDDAQLRLVRYEGGRRGPVLLASGFSMSATSFLVDTVATNLPEHLVEKGYDVWLFDYRASIDLPSSEDDFTLDDIAQEDWPAAVEEVLRVTGAGTVQALGHCVGSASLMMALAAGLRDVRSAVCMQFTLDPVSSLFNQTKAALKVGKVLGALGVRNVAPFRQTSLATTSLDLALRVLPMRRDERCGKALCRWVNAIFGCTHRHEQLNDATHEQLDEMFGVGGLAALEHLATIVQRQAVVDAKGADVYRSHPGRLQLPLLLVQGQHNSIFHPEGSLRTLRWLQESNGPGLYERVVLPDYAHLDALIGRNAARDVYPVISSHLDRFNR